MIAPDRPGASDCRSRVDRGEPSLDIWIGAEWVCRPVHYARSAINPAPKRHVSDRVAVADDEFAARQMIFDYLIMPLRFAPIAIDGVVQACGRGQLKMYRLAGERAEARRDEKEPREELWPVFGRAAEFPGLVGKIEE